MTYITFSVAALVTAGLITGGGVAAAQDRSEPTVGSTVTLTSCVAKGIKGDTFILSQVAAVPAHAATKGGRIMYWLDKDAAKKLRAHVGHQIRVVAAIKDVNKREIEVKASDDGGLFVEIEGPGQDVRTSLPKAGVSASAPTEGKTDIKTTVVELKVNKLEMISERCNLTM